MAEIIYSDGAERVFGVGTTVRVELVCMMPSAGGGQQVEPVVTHNLVLSLDGFARTFDRMEQLMGNLIKSGLIQRRDAPKPEAVAVAETKPQPTTTTILEKSPNFPVV